MSRKSPLLIMAISDVKLALHRLSTVDWKILSFILTPCGQMVVARHEFFMSNRKMGSYTRHLKKGN